MPDEQRPDGHGSEPQVKVNDRRRFTPDGEPVPEQERALPAGSLTDAERWLLYYSLRASGVEIRDEQGGEVQEPEFPVPPAD